MRTFDDVNGLARIQTRMYGMLQTKTLSLLGRLEREAQMVVKTVLVQFQVLENLFVIAGQVVPVAYVNPAVPKRVAAFLVQVHAEFALASPLLLIARIRADQT